MTYIKMEVFPDSRKEHVEKLGEGKYRIWIREKPERNMANRRAVEMIAELYGIPTSRVKMIAGHRSMKKTFEILTGN